MTTYRQGFWDGLVIGAAIMALIAVSLDVLVGLA